MRKFLAVVSGVLIMSALTTGARSESVTVTLEKGWNLKGTSCFMNADAFNKDGITIVWKFKDGEWYAYSPSSTIRGIIQDYASKGMIGGVIDEIEPFDGFWVKTTQDNVNIEFCGTTGGGNYTEGGNGINDMEDFIRAGVYSFFSNANGKAIPSFYEDEIIACNFSYDGGLQQVSYNCPDGDSDTGTLDIDNLIITWSDSKDKIVYADNNTLCVNYEDDEGEEDYVTECMAIDVPQSIDSAFLDGSHVPFHFDRGEGEWKPTGICVTYDANSQTVSAKDKDGNTVWGPCNYSVENGTVVINCDNGIRRIIKAISPFTAPDNDNVTGRFIHLEIYNDDHLVKWDNLISVDVENCTQFWEE
jgi:hypothetical protein